MQCWSCLTEKSRERQGLLLWVSELRTCNIFFPVLTICFSSDKLLIHNTTLFTCSRIWGKALNNSLLIQKQQQKYLWKFPSGHLTSSTLQQRARPASLSYSFRGTVWHTTRFSTVTALKSLRLWSMLITVWVTLPCSQDFRELQNQLSWKRPLRSSGSTYDWTSPRLHQVPCPVFLYIHPETVKNFFLMSKLNLP